MNIRKGLPGGQYKPLSEEKINRIHQSVLQVFEEIGVEVNHPKARELFQQAGAERVGDTDIMRMKSSLVEDLISRAPSIITLCGRAEDGLHDLELGDRNVYMGTGGTALNVQDSGCENSRRAGIRDIVDMARLVDKLDNIHFYMLNVYPHDIPEESVDINRFAAALNHTSKHIMGGVYTVEGIRNVIKAAEIIAGSPDKLRDRPFISMVTCVISPFKLDKTYAELIMEVAGSGIPVVVPAEPLCGATSPVTLAGSLVIQTVDTLAGVLLAQLTNPGTPVIYGSVASITDLHDMKYISGAVEMGLLNAAGAQMAQYYGLPFYATAGMSDAKTNDVQAGYESAITSTMVALAGGNFIHDAAGFLEFCMTASYDKLVIDNEIIGMVMRAVEGIRVDDDTLALDVIKQVGPGGHFVTSRHTRRNMRKEIYQPQLSDRETRTLWENAGKKNAAARAAEKVSAVLTQPREQYIPIESRERIMRDISGIHESIMDLK